MCAQRLRSKQSTPNKTEHTKSLSKKDFELKKCTYELFKAGFLRKEFDLSRFYLKDFEVIEVIKEKALQGIAEVFNLVNVFKGFELFIGFSKDFERLRETLLL
jgi:hypothetical protein